MSDRPGRMSDFAETDGGQFLLGCIGVAVVLLVFLLGGAQWERTPTWAEQCIAKGWLYVYDEKYVTVDGSSEREEDERCEKP